MTKEITVVYFNPETGGLNSVEHEEIREVLINEHGDLVLLNQKSHPVAAYSKSVWKTYKATEGAQYG